MRMDTRNHRELLLLLADPFAFDAPDLRGDRIVVSRHDAADMLIMMQHGGADVVCTSIDELLAGTGWVAVVGHATGMFKNRAKPLHRAFAHLWRVESSELVSVEVPELKIGD